MSNSVFVLFEEIFDEAREWQTFEKVMRIARQMAPTTERQAMYNFFTSNRLIAMAVERIAQGVRERTTLHIGQHAIDKIIGIVAEEACIDIYGA